MRKENEVAGEQESLKFVFARRWTADSRAELLHLLREESRIWRSFDGADASLSLGYARANVELDQFDHIDAENFNPDNVQNFLPPTSSGAGKLFLDALEEGDTERYRDLVLAFFVSNGWIQSPFTTQNTIQGSNFRYREVFDQYLRGVALLGGAETAGSDADTNAVAISNDRVKSQLSALKADMTRKSKLLQGTLANARAEVSKLRIDRSQIRRMAASGSRIATDRFERDRERWNGQFSDTYDKYTKQLEYKSAVELWDTRAATHRAAASKTQFWLIGSGIVFVIGITLLVVLLGDQVASSFVTERCDAQGSCVNGWSAKGPLTIGSILLVASLVLWLLRTLNKFYLSARHLASDAEERKAFAQTFLAFREDELVDDKHEAIVLAALFRPTQDGVVSDDTSPLDPSLVSVLSRRISG